MGSIWYRFNRYLRLRTLFLLVFLPFRIVPSFEKLYTPSNLIIGRFTVFVQRDFYLLFLLFGRIVNFSSFGNSCFLFWIVNELDWEDVRGFCCCFVEGKTNWRISLFVNPTLEIIFSFFSPKLNIFSLNFFCFSISIFFSNFYYYLSSVK